MNITTAIEKAIAQMPEGVEAKQQGTWVDWDYDPRDRDRSDTIAVLAV